MWVGEEPFPCTAAVQDFRTMQLWGLEVGAYIFALLTILSYYNSMGHLISIYTFTICK